MAFFLFFLFLLKKMGVVDGSTDSVFDPTSSDRIRNSFTKIVTTFDHVIAMGRPARRRTILGWGGELTWYCLDGIVFVFKRGYNVNQEGNRKREKKTPPWENPRQAR